MKISSRIAILAILLAGAFVANGKSAPVVGQLSMKSAAPVPLCPPNTPSGCGIMNF